MPKISCEPRLHVLKGCHLNGVDRLVSDTIRSSQIRAMEPVALVDGLHRRIGLVKSVRRNSLLAPRVTYSVYRERESKGEEQRYDAYEDRWQRIVYPH